MYMSKVLVPFLSFKYAVLVVFTDNFKLKNVVFENEFFFNQRNTQKI